MSANQENKRRAYRVEDVISMLDTPLSAEAFEQKRMSTGPYSFHGGPTVHMTSGEMGDHMSSDLTKMLQTIDQKLNYLINAQMLSDADRLNLSERPVNFSIIGMCFPTESRYETGDGIKITMMLPGSPPQMMELLARVTRVEPANGGQKTAVDFVFRSEEEEDQLSHYILKREREIIRRSAQERA